MRNLRSLRDNIMTDGQEEDLRPFENKLVTARAKVPRVLSGASSFSYAELQTAVARLISDAR